MTYPLGAASFDDGWNDGLAGIWNPPRWATAKQRADYKTGWQQARAELLLLVNGEIGGGRDK